MPELPEVETVRKGLVSLVKNKTIAKVDVYWPRIIEFPEIDIFQQQLIGETIETVDRRGKYLIFEFTHYVGVNTILPRSKPKQPPLLLRPGTGSPSASGVWGVAVSTMFPTELSAVFGLAATRPE